MIGKTADVLDAWISSQEHTNSNNNNVYFDIIMPSITFLIVAGVGHDLRMTIRSMGHVPCRLSTSDRNSSPL